MPSCAVGAGGAERAPGFGDELAVLPAEAALGPAVLGAACEDLMGFPVEKWEAHVSSSARVGWD